MEAASTEPEEEPDASSADAVVEAEAAPAEPTAEAGEATALAEAGEASNATPMQTYRRTRRQRKPAGALKSPYLQKWIRGMWCKMGRQKYLNDVGVKQTMHVIILLWVWNKQTCNYCFMHQVLEQLEQF